MSPKRACPAAFVLLLLIALLSLSGCRSEDGRIAEFNGGHASIVFLGDSITIGYLASRPSNTFHAIVEAGLNDEGLRTQSQLFISVDPNTNLPVTVNAMATDPDVVIVEFGVHSVAAGDITEGVFRRLYGQILDCVAGDGTVVVAGTVPWLGWERDSPAYEKAALLSEVIKQEAAKKDVGVADLWSATKLREGFVSSAEDPSFLPPYRGDSFHPADAGHALIARVYLEELRDELKRPPERPYERECPRTGGQ
ncbi:MAG: SGNH/GDSL hydrolase family protein [Dehalococcoidia bacterium]|nr:SGNH/GDSL hydrolase family protein [Dehalococcoidia bacterium]